MADLQAKIPAVEDLLKEACDRFKEKFDSSPEVAACAPGRVNLIGEHIDYCDGFVFPMVSVCVIKRIICCYTNRPGE